MKTLLSEGMPFEEFLAIEPFKEALPLIFDLKGQDPSLYFGKSLKEVSTKVLGWLPPHAVEGLSFILEENAAHPIYHPSRSGGPGFFYFPHPSSKGTVYIFPGGGYYAVCALAEGYPFAERLFKEGYSSVVVGYRTFPKASYPGPVEDAIEAIKYVASLAKEDEKTAFLGFSAGGHLSGVLASEEEGYGRYGVPRPDGLILAYPVTSFTLPTHDDTRSFFLGDHKDDEGSRRRFSLESLVGPSFPSTFMWRCEKDPCVPSCGPEAFLASLQENGVRCKSEILKGEGHGMALAEGSEEEGWLERALLFLGI